MTEDIEVGDDNFVLIVGDILMNDEDEINEVGAFDDDDIRADDEGVINDAGTVDDEVLMDDEDGIVDDECE